MNRSDLSNFEKTAFQSMTQSLKDDFDILCHTFNFFSKTNFKDCTSE